MATYKKTYDSASEGDGNHLIYISNKKSKWIAFDFQKGETKLYLDISSEEAREVANMLWEAANDLELDR